jgi:nucleoside-diphosphate-sugar epimerase
MNKVLLTGATGFIGSHVIPRLLAHGYAVHAVTSRAANPPTEGVNWYQANLLNSRETQQLVETVKPTHLLHLAWYVEHGAYWTSIENLRWVQASLNLLMAFQENGGKRAVIAGTCAEYDWQYGYCQENRTPLNPASLYGTCKDALRRLVTVHAAQTGYSAAWGRIFFTFGPHENPRRLVTATIRALLANQPAPTSHGEQIRDFLFVEDLADAFVTVLDRDIIGAVNLASGTPVKIKDIVNTIARQLNRAELIQLGALPAPANDPPLLLADISRLRNEVQWQPHYDLTTAIDKTIQWQLEQGQEHA